MILVLSSTHILERFIRNLRGQNNAKAIMGFTIYVGPSLALFFVSINLYVDPNYSLYSMFYPNPVASYKVAPSQALGVS
jgi:hypothetical protein